MDSELKCNRLSCRRPLTDKAVVTTCSHIFCIECANELFNAARLCPACDTTLTEPDDVVVCSLQPTNDYKTHPLLSWRSVAGPFRFGNTKYIKKGVPRTCVDINRSIFDKRLNPPSTFQQAVVRNLNDKNAQLQKQLDSVVREANGELSLLNGKKEELERDLELERRKVRELQDSSRDRDKEYTKLKAQFDKHKRRALFGPGNENGNVTPAEHQLLEDHRARSRHPGGDVGTRVNLNAVVGGMEANGVQRTPLVARTQGRPFIHNQQQTVNEWNQPTAKPAPDYSRHNPHRQPFANFAGDRSFMSTNASDRSGSAHEVEQLLINQQPARNSIPANGGWQYPNVAQNNRPVQRVFAPPTSNQRLSRGFRPAIPR